MELPDAFWFQEGPGVRNWQFTNSGIKLLNVGNITKSGEIDLTKTARCLSEAEVRNKYTHFLVDAGDLVIASSGISFEEDGLLRTRGAFIEKRHLPLCMNTSTIRFKAKAGLSDLNYLKFWLNSDEFRGQITRLVTGSAQQNFGPSHLKSIHITLPPLRKQTCIARRLDKADRLRRTRCYALELTDTFLPAVFLTLFGDPHSNSRQLPVEFLGDLCERVTVGFVGPMVDEYVPRGIPLLRSLNVRRNEINRTDLKFVSRAFHQRLSKSKLAVGDVVSVRTGKPGVTAVIPPSLEDTNCADLIVITCGPKLLPSFLSELLNLMLGDRDQIQGTTGAIQTHFNIERAKEVLVPLPPLPLQQKFAALVERVDRLRAVQREALRQAEHLFASLLHRAFSG
jgi:type I restriction enzyme S subunit